MAETTSKFDRQLLAQVFKNPQAIRAFENLQKTSTENTDGILAAQQTATAAGVAASAANASAAAANVTAGTANTNATSAATSAASASLKAVEAQDYAANAYAIAARADAANNRMANDLSDLEFKPLPFIGTMALQNDDYVSIGQFGANGKAPQSAYSLGAAATDLATAITLANNIRLALIACGIGQ
jgi:hypothetical protein